MISHLHCQNYRSLEDVSFPLTPLTAIVGPNGAGKTSILRALDLVLGTAWPSIRSLRIPHDFTGFDTDTELLIEVGFDPPLEHEDAMGKQQPVGSLRFSCRPYKKSGKWGEAGDLHYDFEPLDTNGEVPNVAVTPPRSGAKPTFRPLAVSTRLREQAQIIHIDHRRAITQHLPWMRGSVLGKLLADARSELDRAPDGDEATPRERFAERYEQAMEALKTPRVREIEKTIAETAKRTLGFIGAGALADVEVRFGFADPANPLNSLRLEYVERGSVIPAEELGLGIQSAVVVGVFEAMRQLGGQVGTIVIEEPEMYLHPQAQRYLYRLLTEMADRGDCQVVYASHSPVFADATRFDDIRLARREPGSTTTISYVKHPADIKYLEERRAGQKLLSTFDPARSEVFFARRVLAVEGKGDQLAVRLVAQRLKKDLDAENLAVIDCGAKTAIPFIARTCSALGIPLLALHDEDIYPEDADEETRRKIREQNAEAEKENAEIRAAVSAGHVYVVKPSLEEVLGIGRSAHQKPRRVLEAVRDLPIEDLPAPLVAAVETLAEPTRPKAGADSPMPDDTDPPS